MHRFFVSDSILQNEEVVLPAEQAHQVRSVLRMRPGQRIILLDNRGWEYEIALTTVERTKVAGEVADRRPVANEPNARITLFQSLVKHDRFEWVLQKCTEIGVAEFVPLVTQRTIISKPERITAAKTGRWHRIICEAAEQSQRGSLPYLREAMAFKEALDGLDVGQLVIIPWEDEPGNDLRTVLSTHRPASVALFIGPEGGFAAEEIAMSTEKGAIPVTLGPRILRAETAAVVASALILHELKELE